MFTMKKLYEMVTSIDAEVKAESMRISSFSDNCSISPSFRALESDEIAELMESTVWV